jgi:hypothetical protein
MRLTSNIATITSPQMREAIHSLNERKAISGAIRNAMLKYAHKATNITIPLEFKPPADYTDRVFLSAIITTDLRDEYEAHARKYRIPMSELVLRCLSAYVSR